MSPAQPYQPLLLRVLHSLTAILVISALISGFLIYNTYDKRWGSIVLPTIGDIQGIHGTIALTFLLFLPFFAVYRPVWWISMHRFANTLMLLATTFAVITGRMMKEEWLPAGELHRPWYLAHLIAWICVVISLALHLLMGAKVGGVPLLLSMFNRRIQGNDTLLSWLQERRVKHSSWVLKVVECVVIGGIIMAFILPAFNA
jgi:Prokaryotic cytochrome b561